MPILEDILKESARGKLEAKRELFKKLADDLKTEGFLEEINRVREELGLKPLNKEDVIACLFDKFKNIDLEKVMGEIRNKEFLDSLSEELKVFTGTYDYQRVSENVLRLIGNLPKEARENLELADIGTARSRYLKRVLEHPSLAGLRIARLVRTNLQRIKPSAISAKIEEDIHIPGFNIVKDSPPGDFHLIIMKDILKFVKEDRREAAFLNAARALKDGGILLVGSEKKHERKPPEEPHIQEGLTLMKVYVRLNGNIHKVNPVRFLRFLENGRFKTWEEYRASLAREINKMKVKTRKIGR